MDEFIRKLGHASLLSEDDKQLLRSLAQPVRRIGAQVDIVADGGKPNSLFLIIEGWACRYRGLENGKRQIISILLPGDLCEPFGVLPRFIDHSLGTLTPVTFATVSLERIEEAARVSPRIKEALWWDLLAAWAVEREHLVSLGRRSAVERIGHLLCELHLRLEMVGRADDQACALPITQADVADAQGLSAVHVNRSLQELRRIGLISLRERRLVIHDLQKLRELSLFDAAYLRPSVSLAR